MILDGPLLVLVALAMVAIVAAWVARPLVEGESPEEEADPRAVALLARREMVLADLRDLEEERRLGRITDATYGDRRNGLVDQGARILAALDELASAQRADLGGLAAELEEEIRAAKAARGLNRVVPGGTSAGKAGAGLTGSQRDAAPDVEGRSEASTQSPTTGTPTAEAESGSGASARVVGGLLLILGWAALAPPALAVDGVAQRESPRSGSTLSGPAELPDARAGLAAFQQHCAGCHGPFGRGDGELTSRLPEPPPDLSREGWQTATSPTEIFEVITQGRMDAMMPPFGQSLDAATRWDLAYAVMSLRLTPERLVRAEAAFDQACAECHTQSEGPAASDGPRVSNGPGASDGPGPDAASGPSDAPQPLVARGFTGERLGKWVDESPSDLVTGLSDVASHDRIAGEALALGRDHLLGRTFETLSTEGLAAGGRLEVALESPTADLALADRLVRLEPRVGGVPGQSISDTTGADGTVTFDGLVSGPGAEYWVRTEAEGATYVTSTALVEASETVPMSIYPTATEVPLRAEGVSVLVGPVPEQGIARVVEIWEFRNADRRTRIPGPDGVTLVLPLIPGAQEVALGSPEHFAAASQHSDGVGLGHAVPPGRHEVVVEYVVPYLGTELNLDRRLPVPVDRFRVAITGDALVEGPEFGPVERGRAGGMPVAAAVAGDLTDDQRLEAVIMDLPAAEARTLPQPLPDRSVQLADLRWAVAGLVVVALVVALGYPALPLSRKDSTARRRRLAKDRRTAIATIVALDSDFAEGDITESEYQARRTEALARALAAAKEEAALEGDTGK